MYWILFVTFIAFGDHSVAIPMQTTFFMDGEVSCNKKMEEYNSGKYDRTTPGSGQYMRFSAQCIQTNRAPR